LSWSVKKSLFFFLFFFSFFFCFLTRLIRLQVFLPYLRFCLNGARTIENASFMAFYVFLFFLLFFVCCIRTMQLRQLLPP
jgi:hypothetical protein